MDEKSMDENKGGKGTGRWPSSLRKKDIFVSPCDLRLRPPVDEKASPSKRNKLQICCEFMFTVRV